MFPTILINNTEEQLKNFVSTINVQLNKYNAENYKNCDIFFNENNLLFTCGNYIQRFYSNEKFDVKDVKNVEINYSTKTNEFLMNVPLLTEIPNESILNENVSVVNENQILPDHLDLLKMKKITLNCKLLIDDTIEQKFVQNNYSYGFNGNYSKNLKHKHPYFGLICKVEEPYNLSLIDRTIAREIDESKDFSRDQYKLNFIELQVPDGYASPLSYSFNFKDCNLTKEEEHTLTLINSKQLDSSNFNKVEIECGLISILLGICYDIRTTFNESTCESAWTRTILSSALSYFEIITNLRYAIEIFIRRSLIYPLYRNHELSLLCVHDVIKALQKESKWILKQFLITYHLFLHSDDNRQILNELYVEDYIRYLWNYMSTDDYNMLSKNLKNSLSAVTKKTIRLDLIEIETELLKELIDDVHLVDSDSDDEDSLCAADGKTEERNDA